MIIEPDMNHSQCIGILQETHALLFGTACAAGLPDTGRLYHHFVSIAEMTPAEYRQGGAGLAIRYSFADSPFGDVFVASTGRGICCLAFSDDPAQSLDRLVRKFPNARCEQASDEVQQRALSVFHGDWSRIGEIKLHLKGTAFQLKVWNALLRIPVGGLATYGDMAALVGHPKACRAVGTAVGDNPVAFLIPCHRVVRSTGEWGNYRWGAGRKTALIRWEAAWREQGGGHLTTPPNVSALLH